MSPASSADWKLNLFGKVKVTGNGVCLEQFDTKRAVYLLAQLSLSHRRALTRGEAAEFLWPDDFFDATRIRLRQELSRLRRGLGPARDLIQSDETYVRLIDESLEVDVRTFESLFRQARQEQEPSRQEALLTEVLEMSGEPFLAGHEEPWIDNERSRLGDIRYRALIDLANLQSRQGEHECALETAKRAVELYPLKESAHLVVMEELGKLGNVSDALEQYQQMKRALREGLAEAPSETAKKVVSALRQSAPLTVEPRAVGNALNLAVPAATEPIYGREAMVEHLKKVLDPGNTAHRLVSLTGPGGIGKTRLAMEAAMQLREGYQNRVGWISLADITESANIPTALASQLGVALAPNSDPMERIAALMPREPVLLVLDNLEQFVPDGIGPIRALAEARPNLRLLLTSRMALNLGGERAILVGPLPLPTEEDKLDQPAMRMFLDPLFAEEGFREPSAMEWGFLRQIAEKLEGIPLALQLASGRLRTVDAADLLGQLDKRLDMVNRRVDAPERHRTIRASIAGSFQSLDPELQHVMGRLSVFRGGWDQRSAAIVCELEDPLPFLERLMDTSLIRVDREDRGLRFRMLETIRDYVREAIPPEELKAAHEKHADWIIELGHPSAYRNMDAASFEQLKRVDQDRDNLREAARFCLENDLPRAVRLGLTFGRYWATRSLIREGLAYYAALFEHLDELPVTEELAMASFAQAQILYISQGFTPGDIGPAVSERTVRLCKEMGLEVELAICLLHQSRIEYNEGRYEASLELIAKSADRLRDLNSHDLALALQTRAMIHYYQGKMEEAITGMEEAMSLLGVSQLPFHQVQTSMMLAFMYLETGEIEKAKVQAHKALGLAELYGESRFTPMIQEVCGKVAQAEGDIDQAAEWYRVSSSGWDFFGNAYQYADLLHLLSRIHLLKGETEKAHELLTSAVRIWQGRIMTSVIPSGLTTAARVFLQRGDPAMAARILAAVKGSDSPARDSELVSEIAYVAEIIQELEEKLGAEEVARIFGAPVSIEAALREAFP